MVSEINYLELQRRYGGRYIARRDGEVIASAPTFDELADLLEQRGTPWGQLIIEFIERADTVGVY